MAAPKALTRSPVPPRLEHLMSHLVVLSACGAAPLSMDAAVVGGSGGALGDGGVGVCR
jgi:hypothetical protein